MGKISLYLHLFMYSDIVLCNGRERDERPCMVSALQRFMARLACKQPVPIQYDPCSDGGENEFLLEYGAGSPSLCLRF